MKNNEMIILFYYSLIIKEYKNKIIFTTRLNETIKKKFFRFFI